MKGNAVNKIFNLMILAMCFVSFSGCDSDDKDDGILSKEKKHVKYEVIGSAGVVDITMQNETGGMEQLGNVGLPWTKAFTVKEGDWLYLSAQNQGAAGSVTVNIYVDNSVFKTASSDGAYVSATAHGNA